MAWRSASSDEPVTVAFLLERKVSLDWHEAVSIVLEIAEVFERSGQGALPAYRHLAITPAGSVEFLRGRTEKGHPVKVLAQMLNTLLPRERPTQLRLIVSTAGPEGSSYTSVAEFSEALKYFERPGRQNVIADIYVRARATPPPVEPEEFNKTAETDRRKRPLRLRRFAVPVAAVLVSGVAVAAGLAYLEHRGPGSVSTSAGSLQDVASGAWDAALGVGGSLRDSASRDLAAVFERIRGLGSDDTADPSDEADVDAPVAKTESRARRPASGADASVDSGGGSGTVAFADLSSASPDVAGDERETTEPAVEPLPSAAIFDSSDVNVTPPVTLRIRLPSLGEDGLAQAGVVETIVSASGEVEKVKLVSPPQSVHEAMILSAIKTWRFQPALKDGQPVRYRHLIPISLPR